MRLLSVANLAELSAAMVCNTTAAQRPKRPDGSGGPGSQRGRGSGSPLVRALDTDRDGVISKKEIENAAKALMSLDKNKDGKLTREELGGGRGPGGPGGRGPGGPGGRGPGGPDGRGPDGPGGRGGNVAEEFTKRLLANDKNKDGKISKAEAPERMKRFFDRIDGNKDGFIDKAEIKKMTERFGRGQGGDRKRPSGNRERPEGKRPMKKRPEGKRKRSQE